MSKAVLVFPHHLFQDSPLLSKEGEIYLIEESLFFQQYAFHKQKLFFHRASMKSYESFLMGKGRNVVYINAQDERSDVRNLLLWFSQQGIKTIAYIDPVDNWLGQRLRNGLLHNNLRGEVLDSALFINSESELAAFFSQGKRVFFQRDFYVAQRKKMDILVNAEQKPTGGKWSFDAENRKKYPRDKVPPKVSYPSISEIRYEAREYVEEFFPDNFGELNELSLYPITTREALSWLRSFLETRFYDFGTYEDAIVSTESILHHSVLTPLLNVGLLTPELVVREALSYAQKNQVPLNSTEGFVRQIIGWREFIRGMYVYHGSMQRTSNYWNFDRSIPSAFYTASTGIEPIDHCIGKVLKSGYLHHIERLMVVGNFMLLCEFDPDDVYQWYMELFIDAYDWVMVPNVYGMSQFADGGLMATKPYISGSNYIRKMSDFAPGRWQDIWDALFWRFMHVHRSFFEGNPRLGMLLKTWDRFSEEKKESLLNSANIFLKELDHQA